MVYQIEVFLREIRRWFSRSEWMIRVLGLPTSKDTAIKSGLVIIQIDGLSHTQLKRAINDGNMPFLKKLQKLEHYRLHSLYSGLPSSTPAVQGELFYGVKTAVPTFSFMDRKTKDIHLMYEPNSALEVEKYLIEQGEPLLKGGSAYCNIYAGGAEEPHFCASSFGWGGVLRAANPFVLIFFLVTNIFSLLRTFLLFILEILLAIVDCISGLIQGRDLIKELKFIPTRVSICILLRELVTIGTKIDIARGLPIIHLNLIGYDEELLKGFGVRRTIQNDGIMIFGFIQIMAKKTCLPILNYMGIALRRQLEMFSKQTATIKKIMLSHVASNHNVQDYLVVIKSREYFPHILMK